MVLAPAPGAALGGAPRPPQPLQVSHGGEQPERGKHHQERVSGGAVARRPEKEDGGQGKRHGTPPEGRRRAASRWSRGPGRRECKQHPERVGAQLGEAWVIALVESE